MNDLLSQLLALSPVLTGLGSRQPPEPMVPTFSPGERAVMSRIGGGVRDPGHRSKAIIPEAHKQPHPGQKRFEGGRFFND